jgi:hypothetical protein
MSIRNRTRTCVFAVVLAVAVPMFGDTLPDKPEPQSKTADKEFVIDLSALATAWTLDTISTSQRFGWCQSRYGTTVGYQPDCFESGGFFNGTRDTAKIMGAWAAVDIGAAVLSYELKKHVHNRYLHPLWRLPLLIGAEQHTQAAIGNWRSH